MDGLLDANTIFSINKFFGIKTYSRVIFNTFVILEFAIPLFRMLSNVVQGISIFFGELLHASISIYDESFYIRF